jgi:hypothetical protein
MKWNDIWYMKRNVISDIWYICYDIWDLRLHIQYYIFNIWIMKYGMCDMRLRYDIIYIILYMRFLIR